jgi:hypothetical protein
VIIKNEVLERYGDVVTSEMCEMKKLCRKLFNVSHKLHFIVVSHCDTEDIEEDILQGVQVNNFLIVFTQVEIIKKHTFNK